MLIIYLSEKHTASNPSDNILQWEWSQNAKINQDKQKHVPENNSTSVQMWFSPRKLLRQPDQIRRYVYLENDAMTIVIAMNFLK